MKKPFLLAIRCLTIGAALVAAGAMNAGAQNRPAADPFASLHFRPIGPVGNRMTSVVGEPGNPAVAYIGSADGGVWKTEDGGLDWRPVFDQQDVAAIGSLAISGSEHNVVWAGTGESWIIRPYYALGNGVYKSTDAGRTWQHMGLEETGRIPRIVIDSHDPDRVFVCALGQTHRPQHERGIYRTADGGKTWQQVLFVDENTGCSDLAADPHDPNTMFAGMWQVDIKRWDLNSGGTGSGVYVTHDGGTTWTKIAGHGLPPADRSIGKVAVGVAPGNSDRVYALLQEDTPRFYRSNDRGRSWEMVNDLHVIDERAPYYTRFTISPDDENLIYFPSVSYSISRDGGQTVFQPSNRPGADASGQASPGGDNHDVWVDPTNAARFLVANDAGVSITLNHGRSFEHIPLPIAQMYHVAVDNEIPYNVLGNKQDGSSYRGPSRVLSGGFGGSAITTANWTSTGGCEDGFAVPDPSDPNIVWSGCDNGKLDRMDFRTGQSREVTVWPDVALGWAPENVKYRWDWVFPIAIDPLDHNRVYAGSQFVHMTTDGGQSWKVISPDLTRNDKSHQASSGGITADNLTTYDGATLYAIAASPLKEGVVWAGSDDGEVQVTQDGGAHWTNVTAHIPNLPPWGVVWNITPSKYQAGGAYVAINLQNSGDYTPYVYRTSDFGATWTFIGGDVPKSVNSSPHCIIEDPVRRGMLYLATDNAIYVSWDDGGRWTRLRGNLPPAPMYWLVVQPAFNDLVIATHGRGFWILDDVTALREFPDAQAQPVHLFKPRSAYRFRREDAARQNDAGSRVVGENPPYGADVNFWLKSAQDVELAFVNAKNETIRTLKVHGREGLNRAWWDLRYESAKAPELLTSLPDEPWVRAGRHLAGYGFRVPEAGPVVPPGTYAVRLTAGSQHATAPLEVLADPHTLGTAQSIQAQVNFVLDVRGEINEVADMVNRIEEVRKETEDGQVLLKRGTGDRVAALKESQDFDKAAIALEGKMIDVQNTGRGEDAFREPVQLYEKLSWLITRIDGNPGSGPGGADMAPTAQQIAVNNQFKEEIAKLQTELKQFLASRRPRTE